jgi:hypothetical protein
MVSAQQRISDVMASPSQHFLERDNANGTLDLLCLACRALVAENLPPSSVPEVQSAHQCRVGKSSFGSRIS